MTTNTFTRLMAAGWADFKTVGFGILSDVLLYFPRWPRVDLHVPLVNRGHRVAHANQGLRAHLGSRDHQGRQG